MKRGGSNSKVREELQRIAERCFRQSSSPAGGTINIEWVDKPIDASATGESVLRWGCYSRSCRYPARESVLNISVNRRHWSWLSRIVIGLIDDLLTLYAKRLSTEGHLRIYKARWVRQGRGFEVKVEEGFIVHDTRSGEAVHGATIKAAMRTLAGRFAQAKLNRQWEHLQNRLIEGNSGDMADLVVRVSDSHRAGNCHAGTAAWIERHMPGRTEAKVSELLSVDRRNPRVLAAILAALRRHKYSPKEVAGEKRLSVKQSGDPELSTNKPLITGEVS